MAALRIARWARWALTVFLVAFIGIQFVRPKSEITRMKRFFGVQSAGRAGEAAWNYVLEVEDP